MTNAELIAALRYCPSHSCGRCVALDANGRCTLRGVVGLMHSATDLIEAQQKALDECAKQLADMAAKVPKEGEWIEENSRPRSAQFYCSVCHRTCYDIQPTRDRTWTKRCRYVFCPNCGSRMRKGEQE